MNEALNRLDVLLSQTAPETLFFDLVMNHGLKIESFGFSEGSDYETVDLSNAGSFSSRYKTTYSEEASAILSKAA